MNKNPALVVILSLSLLFSMTEIYKVTMLGFTVLADSDKAAHFCTCTGCSHSHDKMPSNEADDMSSHGMDQHKHQEKNQPSHCSMNTSDTGKAAVCACNTSPEKELPVLYNSLDKVALLATMKTIHPSEKERVLLPYRDRDENSLSKDVFHPPKRV
jgi:hypothetical protein